MSKLASKVEIWWVEQYKLYYAPALFSQCQAGDGSSECSTLHSHPLSCIVTGGLFLYLYSIIGNLLLPSPIIVSDIHDQKRNRLKEIAEWIFLQ